jgi:hypothetical protein
MKKVACGIAENIASYLEVIWTPRLSIVEMKFFRELLLEKPVASAFAAPARPPNDKPITNTPAVYLPMEVMKNEQH